jgi:hypothetical protein
MGTQGISKKAASLKKEPKKSVQRRVLAPILPNPPIKQSFLPLFVHKKKFFLPSRPCVLRSFVPHHNYARRLFT